jgi:hypothetical protein
MDFGDGTWGDILKMKLMKIGFTILKNICKNLKSDQFSLFLYSILMHTVYQTEIYRICINQSSVQLKLVNLLVHLEQYILNKSVSLLRNVFVCAIYVYGIDVTLLEINEKLIRFFFIRGILSAFPRLKSVDFTTHLNNSSWIEILVLTRNHN